VDLAKSLFEFGSAAFIRLRARLWLETFAEAAAASRSFIFTFNPERTVDPRLIDELVATIAAAGGRVHFVELQCARETVLERLGNASRAKFGKLMDRELYEQIERDGGLDFPPLPAPLVTIDTAKLDPAEAASRIEQALARA
jgi:hypothetical protein